MDTKLKERLDELEIKIDDEDMSDDEVNDLIKAKEAELDKNKKDDKTYSEDEFKKAVAARDKAKKEMRKFRDQVSDLEKKIDDAVDPDEVKKQKKELKDLQDFKKEKEEEEEEEKLKNLDDKDRMKIRFDKQMKKMQDEIDNIKSSKKEVENKIEENNKVAETRIEKLRMKTLRADIVEEASKYEMYNTSQIFRQVKDDFEYDKEMDEFVHIVRDKKGKIVDEISVDAYIKEFLKDEANENLLRSKVNKNSMHSNKQNANKDKDKTGGFNPKDPEIVKSARYTNMTPEQYIKRVLIPKDKIKNKKKE